MEKFPAEGFYKIGCLLGNLTYAMGAAGKTTVPELNHWEIRRWLEIIAGECESIGLTQSVKCAERTFEDFKSTIAWAVAESKVVNLRALIQSEMEEQLFLWITSRRASFYSRDAESLVGPECCARFPKIIPEVEEAMKCYAVGRFTASAFHLMRATEAAVKALGLAIGLTPAHPGWKLVFDEVWKQFRNTSPRHPVWATHEDFLVTVSADLRAISKVWRNDIAHFVDTYNEDQARPMFEIVAAFMRDLAKKMDENGKLY